MKLPSKYSKHSDYLPVKNEVHLKWYIHFLDSRMKRVLPEGAFTETHHIVPVDFLPADWIKAQRDDHNIIELTPREHIIAHMILEKITSSPSMTFAYNMMVNTRSSQGEIVRLSTREAANLRERFRIRISKTNKEWYAEYYKNRPTPHEGHKHSEESKAKMSKKAKGRVCPNKGRVWCHRIVEGGLERLPVESEDKIPKGWIKGFGPKGKYRGLSDETKQKMSNSRKNNVWVHKGDERHFVMPDKVQEWLDKGFVLGSNLHYNSPVKGKELPEETKKRMSASKQDGLWVNNGTENKWIARKNLDKYLSLGFREGKYNNKYEN